MKECRELFYDPEFESKLDQDRYKLCCKNFVIDFREKTYRKGIPEDYISRCTNIDYFPLKSEDQPIIDEINEYLHKLFPRSEELVTYVKNHLASTLIGDTIKAQCLHYYNGLGQNGKSLFVKLIETILGEYATDLDISFFTNERPGRGKATPDLVKLIGARFAVTSEPSEGDKLNEGPMKQLTSGTDKISYRGLYKEQESFIPQTHCVIMANIFLSVKGQDHGTWRRIRVLSFESLFTHNPVDNDPEKPYQFKLQDNLEGKFKTWAPVLLSMLVDLAFVNQGSIPICELVAEETRKYREREDIVAAFISENLEKKDGQRVAKQSLFTLFRDWTESTYGTKITGKNTDLANRMESLFGKYRSQPPGWPNVQIKKYYDNATFVTDSETDSISTR
jgi:P4 family phage/plasmid primase-like protien